MCDFKEWIDTEVGEDAKDFLRRENSLMKMEEEFRQRRMAEREKEEQMRLRREEQLRKQAEEREKERERKRERARRAKAALAEGGEDAIRKGSGHGARSSVCLCR